MHLKRALAIAIATGLLSAGAVTTSTDANAQPRKDANRVTKKRVADAKKKGKEFREKRRELKGKHKELRKIYEEKKARRKELKDKAKDGELSDEEQKELDKIEKQHKKKKKKRQELKATYKKKKKELKKSRRKARRAVLKSVGARFARPKVRDELRKHARRMSYLHRAKRVAEAEGRDKTANHIQTLIDKEKNRHQRRLGELKK